MTGHSLSIVTTRRPWAALLALLGMLFVATAAAPLPAWVGDVGKLCSAQGADQPDSDGHAECCVLCVAGHLGGPLPAPVRLAAPGQSVARLVITPGSHHSGRTAHSVQARAPPSV